MKTVIYFLAIFLFSLNSFSIHAQNISCDAFCVTEVRMDTSVPNLMYATLYFSGGNNDFINYPWIAEVINDQGDTIGLGSWNFFGQFGNTSTDYPVTVEFDSIPDNFNATMVFHYDTLTCLLSFPCTMTDIEGPNENQQVNIYPNPFSSETALYSERSFHDLTIKIFDLQGQLIRQSEHLNGFEIALNRGDLCPGIYFVQLVEENKSTGIGKLIIVD